MSIKVTLRQKDITKERKSFYLDFYPAVLNSETGKKTRREFLGLYTFNKPKKPIEKRHNTETIKVAESIRVQRQNYFDKPEVYSEHEQKILDNKKKGELCFIEYFKKLADKRENSNYNNWQSAYKYLFNYSKGSAKFKDLDTDFFNDFKDYLLTAKNGYSIPPSAD